MRVYLTIRKCASFVLVIVATTVLSSCGRENKMSPAAQEIKKLQNAVTAKNKGDNGPMLQLLQEELNSIRAGNAKYPDLVTDQSKEKKKEVLLQISQLRSLSGSESNELRALTPAESSSSEKENLGKKILGRRKLPD